MRRLRIVALTSIFLLIASSAWSQNMQYYFDQGAKRYTSSDFRGALDAWQKGLDLARRLDQKQAVPAFLGSIGLVYSDLADYPKALAYHEQALKLHREIGDRKGEGADLTGIGNVYALLADYPKALAYHEQALKIKRTIGNRQGEGANLTGIGNIYSFLADYPKALAYYEQALKLHREIGDREGEGGALTNIGVVYWLLADYPKALAYHEQALKLHREIGDRQGEGVDLTGIGNVYKNLADYPKALAYHEQALKIKRTIGNRQGEGANLTGIGLVYKNLADYPKALSYYEKALRVFNEIGVPTRAVEANIGDLYLEQGRFDEAFKIFQRVGSPIHLGRYYLKKGEYKKASEEFARSLKNDEARAMPVAAFLLADYIGLGLAYEGLKDYARAKGSFQKGVKLIEGQRARLGGTERERFFEAEVMGFSLLEPYEGMVRVLLKEGGPEAAKEALLYAERVKSRTFLEMLATRAITGKKPEDRAILDQDRQFQQKLLVLRKRLEVAVGLAEKAPAGEVKRLQAEIEKAQGEYEAFIKGVKLKDSDLASLITVDPVPVEKIQSLLGKGTTLLEYYTTKDRLYAWLLTESDLKVYEIPVQEKDLNDKVNLSLLPDMSPRGKRAAAKLIASDEYRHETTQAERERNRERFDGSGKELYDLLVAPLAQGITTDRLIIVPHGSLHKVPFAALSDGRTYMLDKYQLTVLPSASLLESVFKKRRPEKERLLVFANPKTDATPLDYAESEGRAIARLFPKNRLLTGQAATETSAQRDSSDANVLHLASHGEFNERQPLQSGLLLAKDPDNDGFLQVHEIFGMDLSKASLVTLSACETALSRIQGGDDLVGLSRGFIYAGTPSLLATLWKVDDASTAQLMERFYQNWREKGMSKAEALRQAQQALRAMPAYRHPYYWAPFILIGDWQ